MFVLIFAIKVLVFLIPDQNSPDVVGLDCVVFCSRIVLMGMSQIQGTLRSGTFLEGPLNTCIKATILFRKHFLSTLHIAQAFFGGMPLTKHLQEEHEWPRLLSIPFLEENTLFSHTKTNL
jgi:hypothetical protein